MNSKFSLALPRRLRLALAAAALLALAACGGGGSDVAPNSPLPSQPTVPAPNPEPAPSPAPAPAGPVPAISAQPSSVTAASGAPATFSVTATGDASLRYQWLRNGVPVPQAVQASYTVTASANEDGAIYRAIVQNANGEVRSNAAALRLAGSGQRKMIGAIDQSNLDFATFSSYYTGVAFAPSGELLLNINDGAASVRRLSGSTLATIGTFAGCFSTVGMVADRFGNTYMACGQAVLRVASNGAASVFAGSVAEGGNVDGIGSAARFGMLSAIAIGPDGTLYIGDDINHNVRKIDVNGTVSTLAGSPTTSRADGVGSAAGFYAINGLAVDAQGNVYASDSFAIRRITAAGAVSTIAGSLTESGERDGPAMTARFNNPAGLAFDSTGNLFIVDSQNRTVRKLGTDGQVSVFAGNSAALERRDGTGSQAGFSYPKELAIDAANQLYVIEGHNAIRRITPAAVVSTPFALHQQSSAAGFSDGSDTARFSEPGGLSADMAGNLYVADVINNAVRKVSPSGVVTTMASGTAARREYYGSLLSVSAGVDGSVYAAGASAFRIDANGVVTQLSVPKFTDWATSPYATFIRNIAADRSGNRYEVIEERADSGCGGFNGCPDYVRHTLRKVSADGTTRDWRGADVPAKAASSADWSIWAVVTDPAGNLYLSETTTNAIWKLAPDGVWSLFSGTKQKAAPALAADAQGNVYALDTGTYFATIRKITPDGKVTTLAGDADFPRLYLRTSQRNVPAIAIDADNRLWVTQGDAVIRIEQP